MRNSFFLVIPAQQKQPGRVKLFEEAALSHWISELPVANPALTTRLFYDFLREFNSLEMSSQLRLDALEQLRPSFLDIEEYLLTCITKTGFPKSEKDHKTHNILVLIEKEFTIGYWMIVKELTRRNVGWFKGKNTALTIQRVVKGLTRILLTQHIMCLPAPEWVWMDLHSLYKLSVKIDKGTTKVTDKSCKFNKSTSIAACYIQALLLDLAVPAGLMQKEIQQVYHFIEKLDDLVHLKQDVTGKHKQQCIILVDEDKNPFWVESVKPDQYSQMLFIDFSALNKAFKQKEKFTNNKAARFSTVPGALDKNQNLPPELFDYLVLRWSGFSLHGTSFCQDRLDRYLSIGLNSTHDLQNILKSADTSKLEIFAESFSDRALSSNLNIPGQIFIGSMVSIRRTNASVGQRSLGVVCKISNAKINGNLRFEIRLLAAQVRAVEYQLMDIKVEDPKQKALIYGVKSENSEKSYLIIESFQINDGDIIRLFMNFEDFPIVLRDRKNIGLGYWQFECRRITEQLASGRNR